METEHILVTGGSGLIGKAIVEALAEKHPQFRITVLDLQPPTGWKTARSDIQYVRADITRLEDVRRVLGDTKPSVVVHTAGIVPQGNDRYTHKNRDLVFNINVNGTRNMLEAAKENGVKALVYTSSCTVVTDDNDRDYPNMNEMLPTGNVSLIYGQSKAAAENLVLEANSPEIVTCSLRPSVTIGPGDSHTVRIIHACIAKGETPFVIGSGLNMYDFAWVGNIADAHVLAVENLLGPKTAAGQAFFLSNGEPVPFRDFCRAVWAQFGHVPPFEVRISKAVAWFTGYMLEWVTWLTGTDATIRRGSVKDYCMEAYANLDKARRVLGYRPRVGLDEAVEISCRDYKERLQRAAALRQSNGAPKDALDIVNGQRTVPRITRADVRSDVYGDGMHMRKTFTSLLRSQSVPYSRQSTSTTETDVKAQGTHP